MTNNNRNMTYSNIQWMGDIPSEWAQYPTKRLFSISSGSTPESKNPDYWGEDIPWITPADFKTSTKYVSIGAKSITKNGYDSCSTELIPENSIVMSKRAPIGEVSLTLCPLCTNQGCLTCVPNDYADSNFYYYVLATASEHLKSLGNGTTFQELSATKFKEMKVVKPSLLEQQQIAAYLDDKCAKIDEAITKHRTLIEKLKEYRKAVITKAVTKGLDPNIEMKDSGIPWIGYIACTHIIVPLKHLLRAPLMYGANASGIPYESNLPRYIRITDITSDGKLKQNDKLSLDIEDASKYLLSYDDLLFARSGATVGKTYIYKEISGKAAFAGYLIKASVNEKLLSKYLFYYTQSSVYEEWKNQIFIQSTIQNIGADKYSQLPVPVCPITEQEKIISFLDTKCAKIDEAIACHEGLITKLEEYKKSIIYNAVTGKIDCRKDAE